MRTLSGDIWDWYGKSTIVISTNGFVKNNGECVMGRGVAFQAKNRFPPLPRLLGRHIGLHGNGVFLFLQYDLITFPVKHNWWEKADPILIERSAKQLVSLLDLTKGGPD